MKLHAAPRVLSAVLMLALLPSCDEFEEVTVPAVDNTDPVAIAAVWQADEYLDLSSGNMTPLSYDVELDEGYVIIGAGVDSGGTKKITIQHEWSNHCRQGNLGQNKYGLMAPIVRTQPGGVGSEVSNGLWDGPLVFLSDYTTCNAGFTLKSVTYSWHVTAEDFHGNVSTHGWASIHWSS